MRSCPLKGVQCHARLSRPARWRRSTTARLQVEKCDGERMFPHWRALQSTGRCRGLHWRATAHALGRARTRYGSSFVKKGGKEGRRKGDFMLYVALIWSSSRGAKTGGRSGAQRRGAQRRGAPSAVNSAAWRRRGAAAQSTACAVRAPRNGARSAHSIRRTRDTMKVKSCQVI